MLTWVSAGSWGRIFFCLFLLARTGRQLSGRNVGRVLVPFMGFALFI